MEANDAVAMADVGLLERVLANLIDNALRYAPDSVVRVNAGQVGDRVIINVVMRPGNRSPIALNGDCHCVRSATRISRTSCFATLIRPYAIEGSGRS